LIPGRVFKNRVLRKIFGPRREKVTGGWRKFHNEDAHDTDSLENSIGVIKTRI
jgi:hypothetical protein